MIPYDDLVAALTSWRARQGLPVASGALPVPGSGPTSIPNSPGSGPVSGGMRMAGSGPTAKPGSGPQRATPPMAPPKGGGYQPPPLATPDTAEDSLDVDDEALLEEAHYENEGADFALGFDGSVEQDAESTTLGQAPGEGTRDSVGGETELDPKSRKPW